MVIACGFTSAPLMSLLEHLNEELGFARRVTAAAHGQVVEQLLDPGSDFARNSSGLNVLLVQPGAGDTRAALARLAAGFAARHSGHLLVCVVPEPSGALADELELVGLLKSVEGLAAVRAADWFHAHGIADPFDARAAALADVPLTDEAFATVALGLSRVARSLYAKPRKVIAVDCDYTLWGGACGDLDPAELTIDDRYRQVQQFLADRHDAGFMLVVCSRNDPASVDRVFAERAGDLLLTPEHFVARRVNWDPKWRNLTSLAAELGVGVDSFVLVDDDALTCAQTAEALPSTGVVHLPDDADALAVLRRSTAFDRFFTTEADRLRNESYRGAALRAEQVAAVSSPEELNARLETVVEVVPAEQAHWRRIEQLAARTNQFTSATMTPAQVGAALRAGAPGWVVSLRDRFGDYGVVGAVVAADTGGDWTVDALMMSCRALNRGVAETLLDTAVRAGAAAGFPRTHVPLRPTGRNDLAIDFLTERAADVREQADSRLLVVLDPPAPADREEASR
ncbi:HAD-IIIC family phosphatase [Lentzea sp. NPDC060358]|uniref:HAD-IIIC family phosphatase n=1 Tax=Lentzea sp. NPDC060358 TaxID=3347103 RepID=UPI003655A4DE